MNEQEETPVVEDSRPKHSKPRHRALGWTDDVESTSGGFESISVTLEADVPGDKLH